MPPKTKTPAPIDRPLSRAYLREFTGWSTAYPPGLSDPASLRIMENVMVNRDGSARVRPGLRYLSYAQPPTTGFDGQAPGVEFVGTHEPFYLNDGSKAYLFAIRENDGTVGFRVYCASGPSHIYTLTSVKAGFEVPQGEAVLNFTSATTYVKYLQIDNKIFALSNAGETMRYFTVGETKTARKLSSVERPNFDLADKLSVVQPDAAWVTSASPTGTRTNHIHNPSFEANTGNWTPGARTKLTKKSTVAGASGGSFVEMAPTATRINLVPDPSFANDVSDLKGDDQSSINHNAGMGRLVNGYADIEYINTGGAADARFFVYNKMGGGEAGLKFPVTAALPYNFSFYLNQITGVMPVPPGTAGRVVEIQLGIAWYNSGGTYISTSTGAILDTIIGDWTFRPQVQATAPAGAAYAVPFFDIFATNGDLYLPNSTFKMDDVLFEQTAARGTYFDGSYGADYYWSGAANDSASEYFPQVTLEMTSTPMSVTAALNYVASAHFRAVSDVDLCEVEIDWFNAGAALISTTSTTANDVVGAWTRMSKSAAAAAGAVTARVVLRVYNVARGVNHYVDAVMFEQAAALSAYFDGDTVDTPTVIYTWSGSPSSSASVETTYALGGTIPPAETATANTLIDSVATDNIYNFGYFYTFSNEIGESAASQVTVIRAQRPWSGWKWEAANAAGEPNGVLISDPNVAADQLVAYMPQAVYDAAKAQGAVSWSLYMMTWSNQDSVPTEGVLIGTKPITADGTYGAQGWIRHTPQVGALDTSAQLPSAGNRRNYSNPSSGGQGIVAADRLVLVQDPLAPAVIRWSSNQQGEYTNFTAAKGGGYKTLTSGNLYIPAAVKLWQNPQSVDTLTILCDGTDGLSTGYYMAPSAISSQSETTTVMGFEETTATPGTVSPYGCEVLNNALYHPLDNELMKSSANNYNISHKTMTEQIEQEWVRLQNKHRIVSAQHDNRLYYIVHNPLGAALEAGAMGNEIWVFDSGKEGGTWSRWLIQACSLRKIENGDKIYMSVIRPDGIYYLDPDYDRDDYVDPAFFEIKTRFIPWRLETNTQGANRAHDAWANLQQITMTFGNLQGAVRWGIRSWDVNGKPIDVSKITRDLNPPSDDSLPFDLTDYLQVRRSVMEWFLYAESITDELGDVVQSAGQINYVQYRYTPVSVNVGYEYGSVETFEYARATVNWGDRNTDNGVPIPAIDTRRP